MHANVKPFTHWVIYKKYTVRFHKRSPQLVTGVLKTPEGQIEFQYDPLALRIQLPDQELVINEYGWEVESKCRTQSS